MLGEMRREVREELDRCPVSRPAVLRRSDLPDALLACDLPTVADEATVAAFIASMEERGWTVRRAVIWLILDKPVPAPTCPETPVTATGEAANVISLLERHQNDVQDVEAVRAVVKAAEAGPRNLERLCRQLHGAWAEKLRLDQPLPGALLPYLYEATKEGST